MAKNDDVDFNFRVQIFVDALNDKKDLEDNLKRIKNQLRVLDDKPLDDDFLKWDSARYNALVKNRTSLINELQNINKMISDYELNEKEMAAAKNIYGNRFEAYIDIWK